MDRKKVIKGLETCIPMKYETNEEKECRHEQCPYGRENYKPVNGCFWDLMADALELLKEQDAVYPSWQNGKMYCGHCGAKFPPRVGMRFCHRCGVPIKLKVNDIVEQEGQRSGDE